ncbi:LysM peptidoglycan-binding domain-containing protein [Photobacterium sp. 1_MG-2023]|uniref:LysM peptidoglycan-binding domain-containing protein n=1 Tax=Photobacterium sp. 1_MG-2023 TaxID=3062646 RepID=UPI0026E46F73|nr:LysM peptidoglycan-binding domain-containing protein [Photobacterium sp. 1_MG-2023]MDO6707214.1 LysM peptidoglycan-binding domain-containing protein [Photobacterium sp. 1_MG-2023]
MSDSSERQYFPKAHYASLIDNAYDAKSKDVGKVKETEETPPEYEYVIELGCKAEVCRNLKLPHFFLLGRTEQEQRISNFKVVDQGDTTLLVAELQHQESRKLHVVTEGKSMSVTVDAVTVEPKDTRKAREAFIPVYVGLEAGYRLGLPTQGYYYHFMDHKLLNEYKICETEKMWAYTITESTADKLSDQPRSNQIFKTILLPWRMNDQVCKTQHLFHSATKLSEETFKKIDAAWLDTHASKVDLDAILSAQNEGKVQPFEPQPEEKIHVVRQGETLSEIAEAYELTQAELLEMNPEYKIGDRKDKMIPGDEVIVSLSEGDDPSQQQKRRQYYRVQTGDTLASIAQKHGLSVAALKDLNPFYKYGEREHKIYPGDKFIIQETLVAANTMHTVKAKDNEYGRETWGDIADLYGFSAKELCEMNAGYLGNESSLRVGDKLNLSFPELIKDLQKRNTLPAKPIREVNLTDNMIYRFRSTLLQHQLAPLSTFALLSNSVILNLKSLIDAPQQTYKLCLARYALDEVAPDTRTLAEKSEAGFEEKVLAGLNPLNQDLVKKYNLKPSRFEGQTVHTLTLRQIREGYVYVYYEPLGQGMEKDYPHASMLFEYKKSGENFERDGAITPYLPGHFLIGKAYIVFSERQWTERQRSMFSDDPDFRHQATQISGGVYDFMRLLGKPPSEQTVFDDLPQLIADMDAGDANQDDRFASTIMPTKQHVDEKGNPQPFMPVVSNDVLFNTIDEENPQFADILALEDPIAMVEDSFVVTVDYLADWVDWQEENQDKFNVTKAVTGFCNLQLDESDPLGQELAKDPVKYAKAMSKISFHADSIYLPEDVNGIDKFSRWSAFYLLKDDLQKVGVRNKFESVNYYEKQFNQKIHWRNCVKLRESNEFNISCTLADVYFKNRLNFSSDFSLSILDLIGNDPYILFFNLDEKEHAEIFYEKVNTWLNYLLASLSDSGRLKLDDQLEKDKPITNLIGTSAFLGDPKFKSFIYNVTTLATEHYPNEAFNTLISQAISEERLSDWLDIANEWSIQSSSADISANINTLTKFFELLDTDELDNFKFYHDTIRPKYQNFLNARLNSGLDKAADKLLDMVPTWMIRFSVNKVIKSWKNKVELKLESLTPATVSLHASGYGVTLPETSLNKITETSEKLSYYYHRIDELNESYRKATSAASRTKYFIEKSFYEIKAKPLSFKLLFSFKFTDSDIQKIFKSRFIQPILDNNNLIVSNNIPRLLVSTIVLFNVYALHEDYNKILRKDQISEKDRLTLIYRPMWLAESLLRVYYGYLKNNIGSLSLNTGESIISNNSRSIHKTLLASRKSGDLKLASSLAKYLLVGVLTEFTLIVAGAIESYQIFKYDISESSGRKRNANIVKLLGTSLMTTSGSIGLFSLFFRIFTIPIIAIPGFAAGIIGGIIYGFATMYLNLLKEDDISIWLTKSTWGIRDSLDNEKILKEDQAWEETIDGYQKCLEALSQIKNRPKVFSQPTVVHNGKLIEEQVDGYWLFIELPKALQNEKIRVDLMSYPDATELKVPDTDYQFFHIDEIGTINNRSWYGEWIDGYVPYVTNVKEKSESKVSIPSSKNEEFSVASWGKNSDSILLKLWVARKWMPSGVIGYRRCPALLFVWYETDLDLNTGKPKDKAKPHAYKLDLSLQDNDSLQKSFISGTLMYESDMKDSLAYKKMMSLARELTSPKLLNVGHKINELENFQ